MLSDVEIKDLIESGEIEMFDPSGVPVIYKGGERDVGQLQAHGYDLRVERVYSFKKRRWIELKDARPYKIRPNEFVIVATYERLRLSNRVGATLNSLARETLDGLSHDPTTIHPGWAANEPSPAYLMVAVKNNSPMPVMLGYGKRFCRVVFFKLGRASQLPAPSLADVKKNFRNLELEATRYSGIRARLTGWALFLLSIAGAAYVLYIVVQNLPALSAAVIAVVVVLLSTLISWIRNRFQIL